MKFELSMDTIVIDAKELSEQALMPAMKRAMTEILADHALKQDKGLQPDGTAQKKNSSEYAKRKSNPGIRVNGHLQRGEIPTILTGQMKSSRQVVTKGNEVIGKFDDQGGKKASGLISKGYKLHYFAPKNIQTALTVLSEETGRRLTKAIRVVKGK